MTKIIHLIESLGVGGGQTMLFELFHGIKKYHPNYTQEVILNNPSKLDSEFVATNGIKYRTSKNLIKELNDEKDAFLIFHKLLTTDTSILRNIKIPSLVLNHTYSRNANLNKICEATNAIVYVSQTMMDIAGGASKCKNQFVIRNGVDWERYRDIKTQLDRPDFLVTGRINKMNTNKYNSTWIPWVLGLGLKKPLWHDYVGDGEFLREAKQFAQKYKGRNRAKIFGLVPDFNRKVEIIKSWDIFLYGINVGEGISMSMLEALACGIPVVTDKKPSNFEVLENGVNGFVYENRDEAEEYLNSLAKDNKKLENLKKSTLNNFKEKLDIKIVAKNYIDLIEKVKHGK